MLQPSTAILSLRNLKTEFDMKTQIEKLDRLIREIEMDEYLNEETLPKIREAKGLLNTLHEQCNIANVVGQSEQYCDCDKPTLGANVWTCGCGKLFKKKR